MRRLRLLLTFLVILLISVALVLWDKQINPAPKDNGVARIAPAEALLRAIVVARGAPSVRVTGTLPFGDELRPLDISFQGVEGATGSVSVGDAEVLLTRIGSDLYVTPKTGAFAELGAAGKLVEETAQKMTAADAPEGLGFFTRWEVFLGDLFQGVGQVRRGEQALINGVPAIGLVGAGGGAGTLWVATKGDPYPLRLESPAEGDRPAAILDFLDWREPVELVVPPNVLDTSVGPAGTSPAPTASPSPPPVAPTPTPAKP